MRESVANRSDKHRATVEKYWLAILMITWRFFQVRKLHRSLSCTKWMYWRIGNY